MKHVIAALVIAMLPAAAAPAFAADKASAESAASPELQKELQKLKEAYGSGSMSAKEYKKRKEELLGGKK